MTDKVEPTDPFEEAAKRKYYEDIMPRMKQVHEHDEDKTEGGDLELKKLKKGDEVTMEFYPSEKDLEPEKMRVVVTDVGERSIRALASGGPLKWVDKEVGINGSVFAPGGSMMRLGMLEIGLYPEFGYFDDEKFDKAAKKIREAYEKEHAVTIFGNRFDDKYFDEYRTDLTLPTTRERADWLAGAHKILGRGVLSDLKLANFKVEQPQAVEIPSK